MKSVPYNLIEAARIVGANAFSIYRRIVLPLIRLILITVAVFQTMWIWNDFITPNVFLVSQEKSTLVMQVYKSVGEFPPTGRFHGPSPSSRCSRWWSSSASLSGTSSAGLLAGSVKG